MRIRRRLVAVLAFVATAGATVVAMPAPAMALSSGVYLVAGNGSRPALSATGRYVAFVTQDQMLAGDTNTRTDAYVRDVQSGALTLVSDGATRGATDVDISDDGSRVAFLTVGGSSVVEALVRDLPSGALINATRGPSGQAPDSQIFNVGISGDGLAVTFNTQATTLVPGTGPGHDVFVKRLDTGLLEVASTSEDGAFSNGLFAINPSISYDGRRVAFVSNATNLTPQDTDNGQDLYVKDLNSGTVQVAQLTDRGARDSTLNADGTQAVFATFFLSNAAPASLDHHNFTTGATKSINTSPCAGGGRAKLDGSGDRVGMVCSGSPTALFKDHLTNTVLTAQTANSSAVAVSADGGAFAWEDIGSATTSLRVLRLTNTDDTPPGISYELSPQAPDGNNGWYRGQVTLTWHVTDPDSAVTTTGCANQTIAADQPATAYTCTASSDGGTAGPVIITVKRDASQPSLQATVEPASADGTAGWYVTSPTVAYQCTDTLSGVDQCPDPVQALEGTTNVFAQARDVAGNVRDLDVGTFAVDLTNPEVTCAPPPTYLLNTPGAYVAGVVTDAGSGPASAAVNAPANTSLAGAGSATLDGLDIAGRTGSATCGYRVAYNFEGFRSPVDNDAINVGKAGKAVPLKWHATDATGAPITNLTTVQATVAGHQCDLGTTEDQLEEVATGSAGLQNLGNGDYQFNWKTPTSYALSCKTLRLDLGDGQPHKAEFRFTK